MKRVVLLLVPSCLALSLFLGFGADVSFGRAQYKKAFDKKYVKPAGTESEKALAASVKTAKCNICHVAEKPKKERNDYGQAVAKALGGKNVKDPGKIEKALEDTEKMPSMPSNPTSPTFGDLLNKGQLPAGAPAAH